MQGEVNLETQAGANRISAAKLMSMRNTSLSGTNVPGLFYSSLKIDVEYRRLDLVSLFLPGEAEGFYFPELEAVALAVALTDLAVVPD